jgi:RNA polymerase sigma-70 factor (ECF subfamily)
MIQSTSQSLLIRLRTADDAAAWDRFVDLYTPLLFYWARKTGLNSQDAADLVQEVLAIVFQKLPTFQYDESKSFRGWLRTVTLNRHREHCRKKMLAMQDVGQSDLEAIAESAQSIWDFEYKRRLVAQAMNLIEPEFKPATWAAVRDFVLTNEHAASIAKRHGISVWTVYSAKTRFLELLREQLEGLLE